MFNCQLWSRPNADSDIHSGYHYGVGADLLLSVAVKEL